jgi:hypothetical protein
MTDTIDVQLALVIISGLAWTIVYLNAIWIGLRQKTYAMPVIALGLNLAWESTYAPFDLTTVPPGQGVINEISAQGAISVVWALADVVIVYTFFKFGRNEFPSFLTKKLFVSGAILIFASSYAVQWLFIGQFGLADASRYSAFLQNLLMSALFIAMFVARQGIRGQTLTIAIAKWIGTLAATFLYGPIEGSPFILGLGVMCSVLDLVYIGLVIWATRRSTGRTESGEARPITRVTA